LHYQTCTQFSASEWRDWYSRVAAIASSEYFLGCDLHISCLPFCWAGHFWFSHVMDTSQTPKCIFNLTCRSELLLTNVNTTPIYFHVLWKCVSSSRARGTSLWPLFRLCPFRIWWLCTGNSSGSHTHTHFSELPENFSIALRAANTCSIRHLENKWHATISKPYKLRKTICNTSCSVFYHI